MGVARLSPASARPRFRLWFLCGGTAVLLFAPLFPPALCAREIEPILVIDQVGGAQAEFPVPELQGITFQDAVLIVRLRAGAEVPYALSSIRRLVFHWSDVNSGARDPQQAAALIRALKLFQNQPNPAILSTAIEFETTGTTTVRLDVYSVSGARVRTLFRGEVAPGTHTVTWDGKDEEGRPQPAGAYFYRLQGAGEEQTRRLIYLR
jgi:hypothetical protein